MDIPSHALPNRLQRSEYANTTYFVPVAPGVTPAQVIDPDFWQHCCAPLGTRQRDKLRVNDRIEVVAQDGTFDMDLRVIAIDARGLWAQVRVLRYVGEEMIPVPGVTGAQQETRVADLDVPDSDGYRVEFGGAHKFRIVRGNDVIETHLPTKAAAYAKLAEIKAEKAAA